LLPTQFSRQLSGGATCPPWADALLPHARGASTECNEDSRVHRFDREAASCYASIVAGREAAGRPIALADAQVAGICRSRHAGLATRNIADFHGTGVRLINPRDELGRPGTRA